MSAPDTVTLYSSQGNPRIICCPDDPRLQMRYSGRGGAEQWDDEPPILVIGRGTDDEKCRRLARDHDINHADLIQFRDGIADAIQCEQQRTGGAA